MRQPLLPYSNPPFQSRSIIRAMIEVTLSHMGMAIGMVIPSAGSPFSRNGTIETLWRMNEKGPAAGPFVCRESASWTTLQCVSEKLPMEPRLWNISLFTD
jgi:hypothetical protein